MKVKSKFSQKYFEYKVFSKYKYFECGQTLVSLSIIRYSR